MWDKIGTPDIEIRMNHYTGIAQQMSFHRIRIEITDTITISEQPHLTSSLSIFENAKPVESCFEKRIRLVQFLGELLELELN